MGLLFFLFLNLASAQTTLSNVCSTNSFNVTTCETNSLFTTTEATDFSGLGRIVRIDSLVLSNDADTKVEIKNNPNTNTYFLFAAINNRGRPKDLSVDLRPNYDQLSAPPFMTEAPKTSSALVLTDSVNNLSLDVSGHMGKRGRNLSELCRDKINDGYFGPLYPNENLALKNLLGQNVCSDDTLLSISNLAPNKGCPLDSDWVLNQDGVLNPELKDDQRPKRLPFLKACVKSRLFHICRVLTDQGPVDLEETLLTCPELYQEKVDAGLLNAGFLVVELQTQYRDVATYSLDSSPVCTDGGFFTQFTQDYPLYKKCEETINYRSCTLNGKTYPLTDPQKTTLSCLDLFQSLNISNTTGYVENPLPSETKDNYYPGSDKVCPKSTETFLNYAALNLYETSPFLDLDLEPITCQFSFCPGAAVFFAYQTVEANRLKLDAGETGSLGGKIDVFAYDIANLAQIGFQNGRNGDNGQADLNLNPITKTCVKTLDATNSNDLNFLKRPQVNFTQIQYYPIQFDLPTALPSTSLPKRTRNEAVHIYKKTDSSVRQFINQEYIQTKFP